VALVQLLLEFIVERVGEDLCDASVSPGQVYTAYLAKRISVSNT